MCGRAEPSKQAKYCRQFTTCHLDTYASFYKIPQNTTKPCVTRPADRARSTCLPSVLLTYRIIKHRKTWQSPVICNAVTSLAVRSKPHASIKHSEHAILLVPRKFLSAKYLEKHPRKTTAISYSVIYFEVPGIFFYVCMVRKTVSTVNHARRQCDVNAISISLH